MGIVRIKILQVSTPPPTHPTQTAEFAKLGFSVPLIKPGQLFPLCRQNNVLKINQKTLKFLLLSLKRSVFLYSDSIYQTK